MDALWPAPKLSLRAMAETFIQHTLPTMTLHNYEKEARAVVPHA